MKEVIELRVNKFFAEKLPLTVNGIDLGPVIKIKIEKGTLEYEAIKKLAHVIKNANTESFFYGWGIKRKYTKQELNAAKLFSLIISNVFEPTGEECGTLYNEAAACEICGANREQVGPLFLKNGTIPKKDISKTIGGEIVVSGRFAQIIKQRNLKGLELNPIKFENGISDYFQLVASSKIDLSPNIVSGINPFDLSTNSEGEIYKCSKGHSIGLNLLSEAYVLNSPSISENDFFMSQQKIGVRRGLLRPEPIYFCSPAFREMIEEEKLSGFKFEIANIE